MTEAKDNVKETEKIEETKPEEKATETKTTVDKKINTKATETKTTVDKKINTKATVKKTPAKKTKPAEEKIHTFPLRKAKEVPMNKRARKAVKIIRELAARHTKTPIDQVLISTNLNAEIWKRGARKPPSKITVKTLKTNENVMVELFKK